MTSRGPEEGKVFVAPEGLFRLEYPADWKCDVEGGEMLVFSKSEGGVSALRVTAFQTQKGDRKQLERFLARQRSLSEGSERYMLGANPVVHRTLEAEEEGTLVRAHQWIVGGRGCVLAATYSLLAGEAGSPEGGKELEIAIRIIASATFRSANSP